MYIYVCMYMQSDIIFVEKCECECKKLFLQKGVSMNARKWKLGVIFLSLAIHVFHPKSPLLLSPFAAPKVFPLTHFLGCTRQKVQPSFPTLFLVLCFFLSHPEPNYKDRHVTTAAHLYKTPYKCARPSQQLKIYPQKLNQINPKYLNNFFMKQISNNLIGTKSKPHVHNANWPINIKQLEDHPIPKLLSFFSCSQHNIKTPKTRYSSQSETGWEKGGELTTQ